MTANRNYLRAMVRVRRWLNGLPSRGRLGLVLSALALLAALNLWPIARGLNEIEQTEYRYPTNDDR